MLRKKMMRDIRRNFSSFITIFIMTFLGVFVFSGIHAYMDGMDYSGQRYYEENNLQDLWMLGENFSDEDMKDILATDGVKAAERALVINTDLKIIRMLCLRRILLRVRISRACMWLTERALIMTATECGLTATLRTISASRSAMS